MRVHIVKNVDKELYAFGVSGAKNAYRQAGKSTGAYMPQDKIGIKFQAYKNEIFEIHIV